MQEGEGISQPLLKRIEEMSMIEKFASAAAILLATITIGSGMIALGAGITDIKRDVAHSRDVLDSHTGKFKKIETELNTVTATQNRMADDLGDMRNSSLRLLYLSQNHLVVKLPNDGVVKLALYPIYAEDIEDEATSTETVRPTSTGTHSSTSG